MMKIFRAFFIIGIVIFISIFTHGWEVSDSEGDKFRRKISLNVQDDLVFFKEFVVTGYYKPLKRQKRYHFGSYVNDIRINGKGEATFTGYKPRIGLIAADPKVLPFGSIVDIPDYGIGVVQDIGSQIKGNRIDVFMGAGEPALKKARNWGKKIVPVKIIWLAKK